MGRSGGLGTPGGGDQCFPAVPDQLNDQGHAPFVGTDLPQVCCREPSDRRSGIDPHELGEDHVGPHPFDEQRAHGAVGQPLHRRQHQRGLPRRPRKRTHPCRISSSSTS